jgi:hypothetical protein
MGAKSQPSGRGSGRSTRSTTTHTPPPGSVDSPRWDVPTLPHKGWVLDGISDLGEPEATCDMCGTEDIRYLHHLSHPTVNAQVSVGRVCAEHLTNDYSGPRQHEAALTALVKRRQAFPNRHGWRQSVRGNPFIRFSTHHVVVWSVGRWSGERWMFRADDVAGSQDYATFDDAARAAFDSVYGLSVHGTRVQTGASQAQDWTGH